MPNIFPSLQEFFPPRENFPSPVPDPEPAQGPQTFDCAISARAFLVLLILASVCASLAFVVSLQAGLYTSNHWLIKLSTGLFVLLFLRLTEGRWFGLTCRRFATIDHDELTLFGAFGRRRLRCTLDRMRFDYSCDSEGDPRKLFIEYPDGRVRSFSLRMCETPDALINALNAVDRSTHEQQLAEEEIAKLPEEQKTWRKAYEHLFLTPIGLLATCQLVVRPFWSIHLLPEAWHTGIALGTLATLPPCIWWRCTLRHVRFFNLPAHHYWRRNPLGNALAETLFYLKFSALMLAVAGFYSIFFAYNISQISLLLQPRHAATAEISTSNAKCHKGKYSTIGYWKLHVQLTQPYQRFSGDWCSQISVKSAPPAAGTYMVYVRESHFARELKFEP